MLTLLLILVITGLTLAVFFYVGGMFLQGYIYTEPSQELYWQAPAAGGALMVFLTLWCLLVANSAGATTSDIPYDSIFRFSPRVDMLKEPARKIWSVKKGGEKKLYDRDKINQTRSRYVDKSITPNRPWRSDGVEAVIVEIDGDNRVFKKVAGTDGSYGEFVDEQGWSMKDYDDGPSGIPSIFRWDRFLMNLLLNVGHLALWWTCLWLLLRFQWAHAFGLAFVLWLVFTLAFLPMLLNNAAEVAQGRVAATVALLRF